MPDGRLLCAAGLVREGAVLADVGTDHAYLPIYLLERGRIVRAVAADIGAGPLARARAHIAAAGYEDRVETVQTDGLAGLSDRGVTDIAICGMGGELIADILAAAPFVRNPAIHLILQPMTRPAALRRFLAENGFAVREERVCRAAGRVYACLLAVYDGTVHTVSPAEAEVGALSPGNAEEAQAFHELLVRKIAALQQSTAARRAAGCPSEEDEELLAALLHRMKTTGVLHDGKPLL